MPVRTVTFLHLGRPFGGFRMAARPGIFGLDHPAAFAALERAISATYTLLAAHPPATWATATQIGFRAAIPKLGEREGVMHVAADLDDLEIGKVITRACFPFPFWPLGGWVVYEGRYRAPDGTWTPLTKESLSKCW